MAPPASRKRSGLRAESSQSKARLVLQSRSRLFSLPPLCTIANRLRTTGGGKWEAPRRSNLLKWTRSRKTEVWATNLTSWQAWHPATAPPCCPGPSRGCGWGGVEATKRSFPKTFFILIIPEQMKEPWHQEETGQDISQHVMFPPSHQGWVMRVIRKERAKSNFWNPLV